jgi:hypothetical protein
LQGRIRHKAPPRDCLRAPGQLAARYAPGSGAGTNRGCALQEWMITTYHDGYDKL